LRTAETGATRPLLRRRGRVARAVQLDPVSERPHAGQTGAHILERDAAMAGGLGGRLEVRVEGRVRAEGIRADAKDVAVLEEPVDGDAGEARDVVEVVVVGPRAAVVTEVVEA